MKYSKFEQHIVHSSTSAIEVLARLDELVPSAVVFVVDKENKLLGSITDGDMRRGLLLGKSLNDPVTNFSFKNTKFIYSGSASSTTLSEFRTKNLSIIPILDDGHRIVDIINLNLQKAYLPILSLIMAGGPGTRLHPLTLETPKPLIRVGDKPIIEYNIERLKSFGIKNQFISVKYLQEKIMDYFGDGSSLGINLQYIQEDKPLGTIGAIRKIPETKYEYILVMNSDILTNIDYEAMFNLMTEEKADLIIATSPYKVAIPYGIVELSSSQVSGLTEKPTYTYFANAGIYILKKSCLDFVPSNTKFDATDLITKLITEEKKVIHYPILGYWLDIGKKNDLEKARNDINFLDLD